MIWLTWRQFRAQAIAAVALLAAVALYLLISGLSMHHTYTLDLAACTPQSNCGFVLGHFQHDYQTAFNLTQLLVLATPALIGIFWGAPLIGRELETGTHQLAWNQSVTRTHWLTVKLVGIGAASIATAGLLSWLLTWWAGPLDHINGNRFGAATFATRDIAPFGYAAFAFALGTTAGLLLRRAIPAMAVTLAVFIGIQILVPNYVRPNLLPSTTVSYPINQSTPASGVYTQGGGAAIYFAGLSVPSGAWVISSPPVENSSGGVVAASSHLNCFPAPSPGVTKSRGPDVQQVTTCLASYDLHESVTYQPAGRYWALQWYETGIFLALAGLLSGSCFWWIRRRQN
jgi:hypothetical protein